MHMHENFLLCHLIIQMYILHWYKTAWLPEKKERKIGHMTSFRKPIQAVWFLSVVKVVKMVDYEIS